jgi:hypothetical protein
MTLRCAITTCILLTAALLATGLPTTATANAPRCTITGTAGNDRLVGTRGNDVICGLGGNDVIFGGPGRDTVYGGPGNDRISGDRGDDRLYGGIGADRILGGPGHDAIDGGAGADVCPYEPFDHQRISCTFDSERPRVVSLTASPGIADVTSTSQVVTFRARLVDDAAISSKDNGGPVPYMGLGDGQYALDRVDFDLVSGSLRNGIWEAKVTVPRGMPATQLDAYVWVEDVVGRRGDVVKRGAVTVNDSDPDTQLPQVELQAPAARTTYDVRVSGKWITVRTRVTDDRGTAEVLGCYRRESGVTTPWTPQCAAATRVSGTTRDGIWQAKIFVPAKAPGGEACITITALDRAHPGYRHNAWTCGRDAEHASRAFPGTLGEIVIRRS